jgi:exopolysaccharide biosynthesis polyprenyl glycosylphosphotransferase
MYNPSTRLPDRRAPLAAATSAYARSERGVGGTPITHRALSWLHALLLALTDASMVYLAFRLAAKLQRVRDYRPSPDADLPASAFGLQIGIVTVCTLTAFVLLKLYIRRRGQGRIDLLFQLVPALLAGFGGALAASSLLGVELSAASVVVPGVEQPRTITAELWRSTIVWWGTLTIGLIWLARVAIDAAWRLLRRRGIDTTNVLIVGAGESGQMVLEKIRHAPELGYRVRGFVDDRANGEIIAGVPLLGRGCDVLRLVEEHRIAEIIIADPTLSLRDRLELVTSVARQQVNIKIVPDIMEIMSSEVATSDLTGLPMLHVRDVALRGWNLRLKRAMDILSSSVALVVFSPIMMLLAMLVKLSGRREPVFYVQERVGLDGEPFQLVKFRSMRSDAELESGPTWATPDDQRRTRIGAFMRRWSLDELPQLVNVLAGEMSLVGPRPERPIFVEEFRRRVPRYDHRHHEKAGLTGYAQINGQRGQGGSIEERTRYDVYYVENWSLLFDIKIILKTIGAIFRDKNAY